MKEPVKSLSIESFQLKKKICILQVIAFFEKTPGNWSLKS